MTLVVSICAICGSAVAAPVDICYACSAAGDAIAARAMEEWRPAPDPGVAADPVLTVRDFAVLERLARLGLRSDDPAAQPLLEVLDRSRIVPNDALARDVVTLGSRVIFSADDGPPEARLLVLPAQHAAAGWTLPVTTPQGLALLGRTVGTSVIASPPGAAEGERLRVLAVTYRVKTTMGRGGGGKGGAEDAMASQPMTGRSLVRFRPAGRSAWRVADGATRAGR